MASQGDAPPSAASVAAHAAARFGMLGKCALVTGGTKGIGRAVVEELCSLGAQARLLPGRRRRRRLRWRRRRWHGGQRRPARSRRTLLPPSARPPARQVFTCSRHGDELAAALGDWRQRGFAVQGCVADVSQRGQCAALADAAFAAFGGRLDVLVSNVGTNVRKPSVEYSPADYAHVMATNLESSFALAQLCQPALAAARGCLVFNSSVAGGPTCMRSGSLYAMTKAALNQARAGGGVWRSRLACPGRLRPRQSPDGRLLTARTTSPAPRPPPPPPQLTRNLAVEWAPLGIRVNAVAPWYTATELAMQVLADKAYEAQVLARTPMGRIGQPSEVAGAIAYLAGPAASYVTGQVLTVDGGYSVMGFW